MELAHLTLYNLHLIVYRKIVDSRRTGKILTISLNREPPARAFSRRSRVYRGERSRDVRSIVIKVAKSGMKLLNRGRWYANSANCTLSSPCHGHSYVPGPRVVRKMRICRLNFQAVSDEYAVQTEDRVMEHGGRANNRCLLYVPVRSSMRSRTVDFSSRLFQRCASDMQ